MKLVCRLWMCPGRKATEKKKEKSRALNWMFSLTTAIILIVGFFVVVVCCFSGGSGSISRREFVTKQQRKSFSPLNFKFSTMTPHNAKIKGKRNMGERHLIKRFSILKAVENYVLLGLCVSDQSLVGLKSFWWLPRIFFVGFFVLSVTINAAAQAHGDKERINHEFWRWKWVIVLDLKKERKKTKFKEIKKAKRKEN